MGKLLFLPLGFAALAWVSRHFFKKRGSRAPQPSPWNEIARGCFEAHEQDHSTEERVRETMRAALQRLALSHGMVTIHRGGKVKVLHLSSCGYAFAPGLKVGMELPGPLLFCGSLGPRRTLLAIDFASLTNWRGHSAHRQFGWESYLGAGHDLGEAGFVAISCFDLRAREKLFSPSEKEFVKQLAAWIAQTFAREELSGEPEQSISESFAGKAEKAQCPTELRQKFSELRQRNSGVS